MNPPSSSQCSQPKSAKYAPARSARQLPWTKDEDALLGTMTDHEVAEKLNRTIAGVRGRRRVLGKSAAGERAQPLRIEREPRDRYARLFASKSNHELRAMLGWSHQKILRHRRRLAGGNTKKVLHRWTIEEDRLLGTKPDHVLAREFGRPVSAVRGRRQGKRILLKPWRPADDKILGTRPDDQVAMLLHRSQPSVGRRRQKLGVPPKHKARFWTPEEKALLGTRPDREVAQLINRSISNVSIKRRSLGIPSRNPNYLAWKPEELALLGTLPDREVARRTGHPLEKVRAARTSRHIFSVRRAGPQWRPDEDALLGTGPDAEIAKRLNRTLGAVRFRRITKGIPAWRASAA